MYYFISSFIDIQVLQCNYFIEILKCYFCDVCIYSTHGATGGDFELDNGLIHLAVRNMNFLGEPTYVGASSFQIILTQLKIGLAFAFLSVSYYWQKIDSRLK